MLLLQCQNDKCVFCLSLQTLDLPMTMVSLYKTMDSNNNWKLYDEEKNISAKHCSSAVFPISIFWGDANFAFWLCTEKSEVF